MSDAAGYLGPAGTYSHGAALHHFGDERELVALSSISAIFQAVASGELGNGIVPIENSVEGGVGATLDGFMEHPIPITAELLLRVEINLLSKATGLDRIKAVHAHPQALAQTRMWLDEHLPEAERVPAASNAAAAQAVAAEPRDAALASLVAAERYGLRVLAAGIQDSLDNTSRFVVLGGTPPPPSDNDKSSLIMVASHRPGALLELLTPLAQHQINMNRLESRPLAGGNWEYFFFMEVQGHRDISPLAEALSAVRSVASTLHVLGSYPTSEAVLGG